MNFASGLSKIFWPLRIYMESRRTHPGFAYNVRAIMRLQCTCSSISITAHSFAWARGEDMAGTHASVHSIATFLRVSVAEWCLFIWYSTRFENLSCHSVSKGWPFYLYANSSSALAVRKLVAFRAWTPACCLSLNLDNWSCDSCPQLSALLHTAERNRWWPSAQNS